jgi:hypothetical protein
MDDGITTARLANLTRHYGQDAEIGTRLAPAKGLPQGRLPLVQCRGQSDTGSMHSSVSFLTLLTARLTA